MKIHNIYYDLNVFISCCRLRKKYGQQYILNKLPFKPLRVYIGSFDFGTWTKCIVDKKKYHIDFNNSIKYSITALYIIMYIRYTTFVVSILYLRHYNRISIASYTYVVIILHL